MWTTVLVLAVALNLEPNRIGIIGLLLLRPQPIRQLLVFLCASFVTSSAAGLTVLLLVSRGSVLKGGSSSALLQIGMGTFALVAAALLASNIRLPRSSGGAGDPSTSSGLTLVDTFTRRAGRLARGSSLWFAGLLGVGISLPSVDYVALLLLIAASGKPLNIQVTALFTFLVVANGILLLPMTTYLIAKERTLEALNRLRAWVLARSRREYAALLAIAGALMVTVGLTHL